MNRSTDPQVWVTESGHKLFIKYMKNDSLIRTIKNLRTSVDKIAANLSEDLTIEINNIDEYLLKVVPQYENLLFEAFKRGITDEQLAVDIYRESSKMD